MESNTAEKLMSISNEKKLQLVKKATPSVSELLNDKSFRDSITKATNSRISSGNCLNVLNAMVNIEILSEIKKLNENLASLLVVEEEVEDKKKKK